MRKSKRPPLALLSTIKESSSGGGGSTLPQPACSTIPMLKRLLSIVDAPNSDETPLNDVDTPNTPDIQPPSTLAESDGMNSFPGSSGNSNSNGSKKSLLLVLLWSIGLLGVIQLSQWDGGEFAFVNAATAVTMNGIFKSNHSRTRITISILFLITNIVALAIPAGNLFECARIGSINFFCGIIPFIMNKQFRLNSRFNMLIYFFTTAFSGLIGASLYWTNMQLFSFDLFFELFIYRASNITTWGILLLQTNCEKLVKIRRVWRDVPYENSAQTFIYILAIIPPILGGYIPVGVNGFLRAILLAYTAGNCGCYGVSAMLAEFWIIELAIRRSNTAAESPIAQELILRLLEYSILLSSMAITGSLKELELLIHFVEKQNIDRASQLRLTNQLMEAERLTESTEIGFNKELLAAYGTQLDAASRAKKISEVINPVIFIDALTKDVILLIKLKASPVCEPANLVELLLFQELSDFMSLARVSFANCFMEFNFFSSINSTKYVKLDMQLFQHFLSHLLIGVSSVMNFPSKTPLVMNAILENKHDRTDIEEFKVELTTQDSRLNMSQLDFLLGGSFVGSGGGLNKMLQSHVSFAIIALIVQAFNGSIERKIEGTNLTITIFFNVYTANVSSPLNEDFKWNKVMRAIDIRFADHLWRSKRLMSKALGNLVSDSNQKATHKSHAKHHRKPKSIQELFVPGNKTPSMHGSGSKLQVKGSPYSASASKSSEIWSNHSSPYILLIGDDYVDFTIPIRMVDRLADAISKLELEKTSVYLILLQICPDSIELDQFISMARCRGVLCPIIGNINDETNKHRYANQISFPIESCELERICERYRIIPSHKASVARTRSSCSSLARSGKSSSYSALVFNTSVDAEARKFVK